MSKETKESTEFDAVKKTVKQNDKKRTEECPKTNVDTVASYIIMKMSSLWQDLCWVWQSRSLSVGVQKHEQKNNERYYEKEAQRSSWHVPRH